MAATDGDVGLAPDLTGQKVDNSVITRADGTAHLRQRINASDPSDPNAHAAVLKVEPQASDYGQAVRLVQTDEASGWQWQMLMELRAIRFGIQALLSQGETEQIDLLDWAQSADDDIDS